MEHSTFCQSCTMNMAKPEDYGTEKDGSKSLQYCKYCYENGQFTNPGITLDQMKTHIKSKMNELGISENIIHLSTGSLPHLKRWKAGNNTEAREGK